MAVSRPAGIWAGAMTVRPRVSATLTSSAPSRTATGMTRACDDPTSERARCGATRPTNPTTPIAGDRRGGEQRGDDEQAEPGALQLHAEHAGHVVVDREHVEVPPPADHQRDQHQQRDRDRPDLRGGPPVGRARQPRERHGRVPRVGQDDDQRDQRRRRGRDADADEHQPVGARARAGWPARRPARTCPGHRRPRPRTPPRSSAPGNEHDREHRADAGAARDAEQARLGERVAARRPARSCRRGRAPRRRAARRARAGCAGRARRTPAGR